MKPSITYCVVSLSGIALGGTLILSSSATVASPGRTVDEVLIKATPGVDEVNPAAGGGYFAWSQNSRRRPAHFDALVQRIAPNGRGGRAYKINERGTQGRVGSISGRTIAYQQIRGRQADIKFFDVIKRRRRDPPVGVNTKQWESRPALAGNWLLFSRFDPATGVEKLLLRNVKTRSQRTVSSLVRENARWRFSVGQVSGNYAAATSCRGVCGSFVYDIAQGRSLRRPTQPFPETQYVAASVTARASMYFAAVNTLDDCGPDTRTELLFFGRDDFAPTVIKQIPPETGVDSTYAVRLGERTMVYYSQGICSAGASDILALVLDNSHSAR